MRRHHFSVEGLVFSEQRLSARAMLSQVSEHSWNRENLCVVAFFRFVAFLRVAKGGERRAVTVPTLGFVADFTDTCQFACYVCDGVIARESSEI